MYDTDGNDNYLITFALKRRHRDGGWGEEILTEFGLSQREYFIKLQSLLLSNRGIAGALSPAAHTELTLLCNNQLRRRR